MKKLSKRKKLFLDKQVKNYLVKIELKAGLKKSLEYRKKHTKNLVDPELKNIKISKKKFQRKFFKKVKYNTRPLRIPITEEFGIENNFEEFINIASKFIDSRSRWLSFDFINCTRIWPSAVTLLCSFKQWTEITSKSGFSPDLSSTKPNNERVDAYLLHCGFYRYVNIKNNLSRINSQIYDDNETVKIERENNKSEIENRERSIRTILMNYSSLTKDQIENFDCNVLIEAFNNVTEHGKSYRDNGWWTLTQYHKRTGIISLCIADNGIGIKHSLTTGPQRIEIKKKIQYGNDDEYIRLALNENVSGALTASVKDGHLLLPKKYNRGSRRGNGLKRIKVACQECGIAFNILSQRGYLQIDAEGEFKNYGTNNSRVFAGTLFHFIIPAKKLLIEGQYGEN